MGVERIFTHIAWNMQEYNAKDRVNSILTRSLCFPSSLCFKNLGNTRYLPHQGFAQNISGLVVVAALPKLSFTKPAGMRRTSSFCVS